MFIHRYNFQEPKFQSHSRFFVLFFTDKYKVQVRWSLLSHINKIFLFTDDCQTILVFFFAAEYFFQHRKFSTSSFLYIFDLCLFPSQRVLTSFLLSFFANWYYNGCVSSYRQMLMNLVIFISMVFFLSQRSLDQLEALSRKLKERTSRLEAPNQTIAATRQPF